MSVGMSFKKKASTVKGENTDKKQQTLYLDCAKHINYKKIYIYMYIQQTILCKHVRYVSLLKTWCHFINTGNIGIRKHHKKITFWAL